MEYKCAQLCELTLGPSFCVRIAEMWNLFVGLLSLTAIVSSTPASNPPTARVKNGTLEGIHIKTYNQDYFLGIPYAQPPIEDLRFRQAQSLNTSWKGVREAKQFSKLCVGYGVCFDSSLSLIAVADVSARPNILRNLRRLSLSQRRASGRL